MMHQLTSLLVILLGTTSTIESKDIQCHNCFDVASPKDCLQFVTCGQDELCYTREYTDHNGKIGYHLGCESAGICNILKNAQDLLGKRSVGSMESEDPSKMCYKCCDKNLCNLNVCNTTGATPTTPTGVSTGGDCPRNFVKSTTGCYHFTVKNLTWDDAHDACQKMSADLVSFNTPYEYQFLQKHAPADTIPWFWAGGYPYHNGWQWVDGTAATNIHWHTGFPKHNTTNYRLAINNKTPERFTLYEAFQSSKKPFICERPHLST